MSLTEVLVAIGVVALLMAMILPAVQNTREAARALQCKNNLHQMALAVTDFESVQQRLPQSAYLPGGASPFVEILPNMGDAQTFMVFKARVRSLFDDADYVRFRPKTYACPSDSVAQQRIGTVSYGFNEGWNIFDPTGRGDFTTCGVFGRGPTVVRRLSEVTDGLSNTSMIVEILPGDGGPIKRNVWLDGSAPSVVTPDIAANACLSTTTVWSDLNRGARWTLGINIATSCDHLLPPNSRSCVYVQTTSSQHRSGVHLATCDGAVRFVSETVDIKLWRGLGTRQGADAVN